MKHMTLLATLAAAGSMAAAQPPSLVVTPTAAGAPATTLAVPGPAAAATNAPGGKADMVRQRALYQEYIAIEKQLNPQEEKLQGRDPELKALAAKREEAFQNGRAFEHQRLETMDAKLSADPAVAPLVARRRELKQALTDSRVPASPMTTARDGRAGLGPRRTAPVEGAEVLRPAPKVVTPETGKPVENPAPQPK